MKKIKRCLILGGSSEIGLKLANLLLKLSIIPHLTYSSKKGLERIKQTFDSEVKIHFLDMSSLNSIYDFFSNTQDEFEYLIDLAHTNTENLFASIKDETINHYYKTNVINRAIFLKHLVRGMLFRKKGRLIYVSSIAVMHPNKGQGLYISSKMAIEAIYRTIGIEMFEKGISSIIIRPGYISSGRSIDFIEDKMNLLKNFIITPDELAEVILFFLKDEAICFNAREVEIDRGFFVSKRFF